MTTLLMLWWLAGGPYSAPAPPPILESLLPISPLVAPSPTASLADDDDDEEEEEVADPETQLTDAIRRQISEITAGAASYDGKILRIVYDSAEEFEADHKRVGRFDSKHLEFRPQYIRGKGEEGMYCFGGNTLGRVLLKPRFTGQIRVKAEVQYLWVERGSHFMVLVHAGEKDAYWGSDFGSRVVMKRPKKKMKIRPSRYKAYNTDPSKWVDKKSPYHQVLEVTAEKKLILDLNADRANEIEMKDGPEKGQVGFHWDHVKFTVIKVEVQGVLDREWAAETIGFVARTAGDSGSR